MSRIGKNDNKFDAKNEHALSSNVITHATI
jgi:hypothetical protein